MSPALFDGTDALDEYTYCLEAHSVDSDKAQEDQRHKLHEHWKHFVTKQDFQWLKSHGIEAVRIPIGHWIFGDSKPYIGPIEHLDNAFKWSEALGLKIVLSLHGAVGSQNGEIHSGHQGSVSWHSDQANIDATLDTLRRLAQRYRPSPALLGIGLLNEPALAPVVYPIPVRLDTQRIPKKVLKQFYYDAYDTIRGICGEHTWIIISDGFQPKRWNSVLHRYFYHNTYIDSHQYQLFTAADKSMTATDHIRHTVSEIPLALKRMRRHHPIIVGEWSAALDPKSMVGLDADQQQAAYKAYCNAQMQTYDRMDAWFYWSYKVEGGGPWSFRDCYEKGWFDFG